MLGFCQNLLEPYFVLTNQAKVVAFTFLKTFFTSRVVGGVCDAGMKRPCPMSTMATVNPANSRPQKAPTPSLPSNAPSTAQANASNAMVPTPNLKEPIPLTSLEDKLFNLLLDVVRQPHVPNVTLRVAGGWVRDKILFPGHDLGKEVDIDIALDTMLGNDFAELVNDYLEKHDMDTGSVGLIQKNPDQSKHLETATMRVLDVCLDLVNLRTETYSHDSRIPDVQIGTPREDALRRDLTINALFYNIGRHALEDFTGRGFDDIRARIIRTPLPPLTTLLDDPLRALRAVRFAARLNFTIHDDLVRACKHPDVHDALAAKVSRERISGELHRILGNGNAPHAIALLVEFGLFPVVLRMPPMSSMVSPQALPDDMPLQALSALVNLHSLPTMAKCTARVQLVRYAAILSPLAGLRCIHSESGKRPKEISVAQYVMRVQLRLSANDASVVCSLLDGALAFKSRVHKGDDDLDRLQTAKAVRIAGPFWRSALRIALVMELPVVKPADSFAKVLDDWGGRIEFGKEATVVVKTYDDFQQKVESLGLEGVWDVRPVVNGNELFKLLPSLKKGPMIGQIMKNQVDWMIQNPGRDKNDVIDWIKITYSEYTKVK